MLAGTPTCSSEKEVLDFFKEPRLTTLYQTSVLYRLIEGHEERDRIAELVKLFETKRGAITREFLLNQTRERIKKAQKPPQKRRGNLPQDCC